MKLKSCPKVHSQTVTELGAEECLLTLNLMNIPPAQRTRIEASCHGRFYREDLFRVAKSELRSIFSELREGMRQSLLNISFCLKKNKGVTCFAYAGINTLY